MQLLPEEVGLRDQEHLGALELAEVEPLRLGLGARRQHRVDVGRDVVPECLRVVDDLLERLLLLWLEGEVRDLVVPVDQLLDPRPRGVARDPDAVVTDRAGPGGLVVVLDLASGDFEALPVVPKNPC